MKIIWINEISFTKEVKRLLLLMKITLIILFICIFQLQAVTSYGQSTKFSIETEEIALDEVFRKIEEQSEFLFNFRDIDVSHITTRVNIENGNIKDVLTQALKNTHLSFYINDRHVTIFKLPREPKQEQKVVTGNVKDNKGELLLGVSIIVKGTTQGTVTDIEGNFSIEVPDNAVLVFTYLGYTTREISVAGKSRIDVVMTEDTQKLEEVVVVGYGTQKKVNLTGAIGIADNGILENRPIGNIAQGLQGVVPNLNIDFASGDPAANTTFNIRGVTSLNGGSALLLVDGVETSDLSLLNPQDIESVSVLKDAASASIYGARAAFGVVLITTKKGKKDQKVQINYNNNISWSKASRLPDGISSDKWVRAINQAHKNSGNGAFFSQTLIDAIDSYIAGTGPSSFAATDNSITAAGEWAYAGNTDWLEEMYQPSFMQQHNASISGGSEKSSYYGALGYKGQEGLFRQGTDKYNRINMTFNYSTQVTDWLELTFRTKYNRNTSDTPNTYDYMNSSPHYEVYRSFPYIPLYTADGDFAGVTGTRFNYNMVARLAEAGRSKVNSDDFWYTAAFNLTPFAGLSIKGDYTGNKFYKDENKHYKVLYQTNPDGSTTSFGAPNSVTEARYGDTYQALNLWADYKKSFNNIHNLGVMVGYNQESKKTTKLSVKTTNLFDNNFSVVDLASTYNLPVNEATIWAVQGAFFRLNYDYKQRYLLEVNGRYDGSSKYASGNRWGFFPSFSAGWRISEEDFFEPVRTIFDNLKVRASYGGLGNQVTDGNFQYLSFLSSQTLSYLMDGNVISGLTAPTLASSNITWEKVYSTNIGLDWTMLNGRFSGSLDYYIRDTKDMVVRRTYPAVLGTTGGKENLADMRTKGMELSVTWRDEISNVGGSPLGYSVGIGISDNTSEITKYDNPTKSLNESYYEGMKIGEIWGYVTDGFIVDEAEAQKMAERQSFISTTWLPGDIRYTDLNGDGKINRGNNRVGDSGDRKVIGNNTPRYNFNLNLSGSWKGFDLRLFFQGTMKRDIWLDSPLFWGYSSGVWQATLNDYHVDNSWSETNTNAYYPIPIWGTRSKQAQTKYLQNGAFIRLKDVTLSYTLPKKLVGHIGLQQMKVYVSGQNLWEATGLYKYLDLDVVGSRKSEAKSNSVVGDLATESGGRVYPFTRSYSFGINVTF